MEHLSLARRALEWEAMERMEELARAGRYGVDDHVAVMRDAVRKYDYVFQEVEERAAVHDGRASMLYDLVERAVSLVSGFHGVDAQKDLWNDLWAKAKAMADLSIRIEERDEGGPSLR
jgi:hypothetical protein